MVAYLIWGQGVAGSNPVILTEGRSAGELWNRESAKISQFVKNLEIFGHFEVVKFFERRSIIRKRGIPLGKEGANIV